MLPTTEPELDEFIAAFEDGTLPKARWTHGAHLLTGACYVHMFGVEVAEDRMRVGVKRYNLAVGGKNTEPVGTTRRSPSRGSSSWAACCERRKRKDP